MSYEEFLASKNHHVARAGIDISTMDVHAILHPWQAEIVVWAVGVGRAAIWADTGLGKTFMQIEWARLSGSTSLIVAPLAVCQQTVREAAKLGVMARYVRDGSEIDGPGVWVTNYEMVTHFDPSRLDAVVLDESSILKQSDGKTRTMLIEHFRGVPRRLSCTATPAPNDPEELTSQAEFLGVMTRVEMLSGYFVHDSDRGWRLKGHARGPMFRWMADWAVAIRRPSDMGYADDGYDLPGLTIKEHLLAVDVVPEGQLFATEIGGVGGRAKTRRLTLSARVDRTVQLVYDCATSTQRSELHDRVLQGQQREVAAHGIAEGTSECITTSEVRGESCTSRSDARPDAGVQAQASVATDRDDVRDNRGTARTLAGPGMSVVSCDAGCEPGLGTSRRPQPLDGHGPRCSLSAVQPGAGTALRRPSADNVALRVPYACRDQWVIWCGLNDEQDALVRALGDDCQSIDGRTPVEKRVEINDAWCNGEFRVLIVKPGMYSYGMNWQHCHRIIFVGLSDSYEQYYQAIRRCYRYGQTRVVQAHVVLSDLEGQIAANIRRKETEAARNTAQLVAAMHRTKEMA